MRFLMISAAALIGGGMILAASAGSAGAAPLPSLSTVPSLGADATGVETVGWRRRYWRRHGVWPAGPGDAADAIIPGPGETVVVTPVRPLSCGEFHYWNGVACVDARYNDPYLGPK